ncbi:MAG: PQQ-binding-like beta-propeller repeat protein, partial [Candidatus Poribacteria bacterium]|nr:PQQ-binding-like beta-propeller repeat protein [Candidatus Poribacteria bacterium]
NTIVIVQDHEGPSFIVALDKRTGDKLWKMDRDERTTWTSPIVVEHGGKAQVIVSATNRSRSYDLETGEVLWECGGMTGNVIPTPIAADGFVYLISGFRGAALQAVNLANAMGDITESEEAIAWELIAIRLMCHHHSYTVIFYTFSIVTILSQRSIVKQALYSMVLID